MILSRLFFIYMVCRAVRKRLGPKFTDRTIWQFFAQSSDHSATFLRIPKFHLNTLHSVTDRITGLRSLKLQHFHPFSIKNYHRITFSLLISVELAKNQSINSKNSTKHHTFSIKRSVFSLFYNFYPAPQRFSATNPLIF